MIAVGSPAPDATVFLAPLKPLRLSRLYDEGTVLLLFFPLAFSATCTEEMCTVAADTDAYHDLGARVYGVSVDSPYVNERFAHECRADFPILSDFNREATRGFDIARQVDGLDEVSERAAFVVSGGTIRHTWVGEHPGIQVPFDELKEVLRRLDTGV